MIFGVNDRATIVLGHSELAFFSIKHNDILTWVCKQLPNARADVRAAVAKAALWYGTDAMEEFCEKLRTLVFKTKGDPVGQLYKTLSRRKRTDGLRVYKKTLSAIEHYRNESEVLRLKEKQEDIFEWEGEHWDLPRKNEGENVE
jgi:hypothetical protein